ncbi:MAG TPA: hypothetical protein VL547_23935 [Dinghuibacter sp.]|uniref:hypothetical protein n=1 Tax=Dinghuibacter sp. TaxID=2024697 RepID=UPI002C6CD2F3|nr:hypothetical protein [Dinghuibacter sp.]HTJ15116.1 hypothetical protein [Dinghuibacter sp.]
MARRLLWIGVVLTVAIVGIDWGIRSYLKPRIGALIERIVVEGSDSLYRFASGPPRVNLWSGTIALRDCRLTLDSARYTARLAAGDLPALTAVVDLEEIRVSGLRVFEWWLHKRVVCGRLTLVDARASLYRHRKPSKSGKDLYTLLRPVVRSITIGEVLLGDVRLSYDNGDSARPFRWAFERCDLRLRDIQMDSSTVSDSTRFAYAHSFTMGVKNVSILVGRQLYRLRLGSLTYDFAARAAALEDFSLSPALDADAFYRRVGHQADRYTLRVPSIGLYGVNMSEMLLYAYLHVDSAHLERPDIRIYHDRTQPPDTRSKVGRYPQQLLQKAPIDILIRRLSASSAAVEYAEKNPATDAVGTLSFDHVGALLSNVTNLPGDPRWTARFDGYCLGRSPISALFTFYLGEPSGRFSLDAHIGNLDAAALNPLTGALAKASTGSFHMDRLDARITGDENGATGDVRMRYDHLRLTLLKGDTARRKPLLSFLVNTLAVRSGNPNGVATGVRQTRDPHKSFFNLIWKTLYAGVKQIALRHE